MKYLAIPLIVALACGPANAKFAGRNKPVAQAQTESAGGANITPITAIRAGDGARIARLRAIGGGEQFRPTIVCDTDIANNAEWSGENITILAGGACPSYMRNRK